MSDPLDMPHSCADCSCTPNAPSQKVSSTVSWVVSIWEGGEVVEREIKRSDGFSFPETFRLSLLFASTPKTIQRAGARVSIPSRLGLHSNGFTASPLEVTRCSPSLVVSLGVVARFNQMSFWLIWFPFQCVANGLIDRFPTQPRRASVGSLPLVAYSHGASPESSC